MTRVRKFFLIALLCGQFFYSVPSLAAKCFKYLQAESLRENSSNFQAGPYKAVHYPVSIQLDHLNVRPTTMSDKRVAVLGDGFSGLGLELLRSGVDVQLYDPLYSANIDFSALNNLGRAQVEAYKQNLPERMHANSATKTDLEANTVDMVLSHLLINNLTLEKTINVFIETLRILHHQGEARFVTQVLVPIGDTNTSHWLSQVPSLPYLYRMQDHQTLNDLQINVTPPVKVSRDGRDVGQVIVEIRFTKP